jgi:hypothetical protein
MNIKEKEAYIEHLKDTLEGIKYPENPFSKYVILEEYYESSLSLVTPEYITNAHKAFKIAQSLSTDITE